MAGRAVWVRVHTRRSPRIGDEDDEGERWTRGLKTGRRNAGGAVLWATRGMPRRRGACHRTIAPAVGRVARTRRRVSFPKKRPIRRPRGGRPRPEGLPLPRAGFRAKRGRRRGGSGRLALAKRETT